MYQIKEIHQLNTKASPEQDQVSNFDNRQTEFSKSPMVISDSEELRDDFRSENCRGSNGIGRIPEGLRRESGSTNSGCLSPTWKMEQGSETFDKQKEEDGSHILRPIPSRINLQELQIKAI
ncbi:MAG: hypothetical protein EZS28_015077, partial [Streblomastix strix]